MLRTMRENASSFMIKILLGIIVLAFVFMGVGSFREDKVNKIASVNGEPISYDEYQKVYRNILDRFHSQYGNRLDDNMIKMFNLKQRAIDNLVQEKIILRKAENLRLKVTDEELSESILNMKAFQTAGRFDVDRYTFLLNRLKLEPAEFEIDQKKMLLSEKLRNFITGNARVSNAETLEWFNWENALVDLDVVQFLPANYADINAESDELKDYYEKNQTKYQTKPEVKARYVSFPSSKYKSKVNVSDDEINLYYQDNKDDFYNAKTVEARHILVKVDQAADDETIEKAKQKTLDILEKVKKGNKTFAELAKKYSEGPSKTNGGHLGTFKKETMVKPFSDKAFFMSAGEVSEPVRTKFGWHIIRVEKVNDAYSSPLDEVKNKITDTLLNQKAKTAAYDEATSVFEMSFEGDDLIRTAEDKGLELLTTDFFTRIGPKKIIVGRDIFSKAAFALLQDQVSDVLEVKDGFYLLQVVEKNPAGVSPFEEVKVKIEKDVIKEKQKKKAKEDAEAFLSALKSGEDLKKESAKLNIKIISTGFFKRHDPVPEVGREQEINKNAFKLSGKNSLPETIVEGVKGYYVIRFKDRKKPALEEFEKEKNSVSKNLLMQKKNRVFEKWLAGLKEKSEISIKKEFL
ncbi:MAG: SurA N-terminal domain-containing protein [Deltaproteobacteria bacterium]|nr:SurA N-terminal domain-containing protein [Deltaproteobacteria bacterium]